MMSPISNGAMYPDADQGTPQPHSLRILSLETRGDQLPLHYLAVLRHYLDDLQRDGVRVELLTTLSVQPTGSSTGVTTITLDPTNQSAVPDLALTENVDIIHDPDRLFGKRDRFRLKDSFAFTTTKEELATQIQSYLTGHGIAWQLYEPIWRNSWLYKYTRSGGIAEKTFNFIAIAQRKNYSAKQLAYVRSLANKALSIEYAREQLYYYQQLKRRAFRQQDSSNDFSFELVYHLSNYTFFICSVMDVLARLLNETYTLGFGRFQPYSIEKTNFIAALSPKRKTLADIFRLKKYQDWMGWMKVRRNDLAHESHAYLTPLVQRSDNALTDAELEQRVDQATDWALLASVGDSEHIANMRAVVRQNLDVQLNYEVVVSDMMILERLDPQTRQPKTYIVFPLRTIDEDFAKIGEIIDRALDNLSSARRQRDNP